MSTSIPKQAKSWTVQGKTGFDSLQFKSNATIPEPSDYEVLVKLYAASLNYRDLIIPKGQYPFPQRDGVVPGSDGAGEVVAVGPKVTLFQKGDKVLTLFNQGHLGGELNPQTSATGVGGVIDGTLREYGTFNENGLVSMPSSLSYEQGSTLTCAGLTAWNALYGSKPLAPGDVVLTQGTGGVSIFALQFAKAAGAIVISTTSSPAKSERLKQLGADHVINYKEVKDWGKEAKRLTPNGEGVDHVIEVGGPESIKQSFEAIKIGGVISVIGFVGGVEGGPGFLEPLMRICTVRGILVGNRVQFEAMNRAIDAKQIKPVVDDKMFKLDELKEAYQYMWDQKHFGKLVIQIS